MAVINTTSVTAFKSCFWDPVLNMHLMVICSCQFNVLFYYCLSIVYYKPQGIRCNDGPQAYHEWLGSQFVDPWIEVQRCIKSYQCKASVKKITEVKSLKVTGNITCTVDQHVQCTKSRKECQTNRCENVTQISLTICYI